MKLASSPCRKSSITTFVPAEPNIFFCIASSSALCASSAECAMVTPFPAARPSALITIGNLDFDIYSFDSS